MTYQFRTITDADRRQVAEAQLRTAELDLLVHSSNAEMAAACGDTATAEQQTALAQAAEVRATTAANRLDNPPEGTP